MVLDQFRPYPDAPDSGPGRAWGLFLNSLSPDAHHVGQPLLSVMVTGPLRKQVLVRRALLGRFLAELCRGKPQNRPPAGLRPAGGRV